MWFRFHPDTSPGATRQERLFRYIRDRILSGDLPSGAKVPSTRALATRMCVSRNTVSWAYESLVSEGYLEVRLGAGTFVAGVIPDIVTSATARMEGDLGARTLSRTSVLSDAIDALERGDEARQGHRRVPPIQPQAQMPVVLHAKTPPPVYDFRYGSPDPRDFPTQAWRRLASECLSPRGHGVSGYVDPAGLQALREVVVAQLAATRGVHVPANRVVITSGAQEGLSLIAQLLVTSATTVAVEDPGYGSAAAVFEHQGATLLPVPLDDEGFRVDTLPPAGVAVAYVTPSHQFPTGVTMTVARRVALLAWAGRAGSYVIEDDYDSDYRYEGPPLAALAALDRDQRVLYLGSFSKALGAGLRIGYVVVPEELVVPLCALKQLRTYGQSWLEQSMLAAYMRDGAYERRLRHLRKRCLLRRNAVVHGLRSALPWSYTTRGEHAGMHFSMYPDDSAPPTDVFVRACQTRGVRLYAFSDAGVYSRHPREGLREPLIVGYSQLTPSEIFEAMTPIHDAARAACFGESGSSF